jgi:hypothetical protein
MECIASATSHGRSQNILRGSGLQGSTEKAPARKALNIVVFTIICFKKTEALLQSH